MILVSEDLFACYNGKLYKYLTKHKHIPVVSMDKNTSDNRMYALFTHNNELTEAIREYRQLHNI